MVLAATIDRVASDALAKVEEKCPVIAKPPNEVRFTDSVIWFVVFFTAIKLELLTQTKQNTTTVFIGKSAVSK